MSKQPYFLKKKSYLQITAGLLSASVLMIGTSSYAATINTQYVNSADQTIQINNGDTIQADSAPPSSGYFAGVYGGSASNNLIVNLGTGSSVLSDTGSDTTNAAIGIYVRGPNTQITADQLTIDVSEDRANGISVQGLDSTANLGSNSTIKINSTGSPTSAYGINLRDSSLRANALTIEAQGANTSGVSLAGKFSLDLGSNSSIYTTGNGGVAINIANPNSPSTFIADALTIQTDGTITGSGNGSFNSSGSNAVSTIGAGSKIIANGSNAMKAQAGSTINFKGTASQRNTIFSGKSDYGGAVLSSQAGSIINLANTDITVDIGTTSSTSGIWAQTGGTVNGENLTVNMLQNGFGVVAYNPGGTVNLSGTNIVTVANNQYAALFAPGGNLSITGKMTVTGNTLANQNGVIDMVLDAGSIINGDVTAGPNGNVSLNLSNSALTGKTTTNTTNGVVDLTLANSNWQVSGASTLSTLAMNNGNVAFNQIGTTVTTENLSGSGTFNMQADVVGGTGDQLIVTGTSAGSHHLKVKSSGSDATTGNETLTLVQTTDAGAAFDLTNQVDLGGYRYNLRQNGNNWELYSSGLTPTASGTLSFINTSYLLNYAETQTLLQRMGELRQSENSNGDVWVRAFAGKFGSFGDGKLDGFDMDYTGVQAGVDKRLNVSGADVYLGVMGGTSKADTNYKEGDGDVTGYHFGLYGTYVAANDFYIDAVLKYSNFKNSFNVQSADYGRINSDVDSDGYGLSLEAGKRFYFDASKAGYYIEPQAQISYAHQGSASTTASDGLNINMDSYDSTLGRISALFGYEVKNSQTPMNVYFKTGYVTEMSGDTSYSLNGNKESYDFGGDWWENSIGITAQINKKHNLYLEGTYSSGNKFDQTQLNAGYRYSF